MTAQTAKTAPRRSLAAAFRFDPQGRLVLVQPELDELASPDRDLWLYWLVRLGDQKYVQLEVGGLFYSREPVAANWWETPDLARMLRQATW
jgi:hypothetical protein